MDEKGKSLGFIKSNETGIHLDLKHPFVGSTPDCVLVKQETIGNQMPYHFQRLKYWTKQWMEEYQFYQMPSL